VALPRLQLFEFNDARWVPEALRETVVSALSRTLRWGRVLDGLVDPFARFLNRAGTHEVLDLCAGAGGPAAIFSDALAGRGVGARFVLCDLYPRVEAWRELARGSPGLGFLDVPVDATTLDSSVGRGHARSIVNALHHFPPAQARAVLEGACRDAPGLFVAEGLDRNLLSFASMGVTGLAALLSTPPFVTHRVASALLTWASPVALAASVWDGSVSCLRAYTEGELRELVRGVAGWQWEFSTFRHGAVGRGSWFMGWPDARG
jgi:hypothetical protein